MSIKEKLESLGRNSIQLKIARKETYKLGATRFGGKPDVPPDFVWPTYEGESYDHVVKDRPLTFLAQFNCAELAQFDKEHLLPDHGLLSFFYETDTQCWGYDPKNQGCARVYWFEDMSALSAADFPADMGEDFKFPMVKIKLDAKTSYPSWQDFSEMFPDEKDDDAFNDALDELTGEDPENPDDRSQLLGWPDVIQNSMFDECDLVTQGYYLGNGWLSTTMSTSPSVSVRVLREWDSRWARFTVRLVGYLDALTGRLFALLSFFIAVRPPYACRAQPRALV